LEFLTVTIISIENLNSAGIEDDDPLPRADVECDRCHAPGESGIAIMCIPEMEQEWALCALCLRELPKGFQLV
jgi:hypothetical protein